MQARPRHALPEHPDLDVLATERVWDGRFPLDVVRFRQRRFDGAMSGVRTWELWRRGRAAAVLPYDPAADRVVLIEQFRLPALAAGVAPVMVEIPAGFSDPGETPAETVRREMREEMGLAADRLIPIGRFVLTAGASDETAEMFAGQVTAPCTGADGIAGHHGAAAEHEDILVRVWPAERAIEAALAGRMPNSVTSLALMWLAAKREWLRREWLGE